MAMREPAEADIQRACLEVLRLRGVWAWRTNSGAVKVGKRLIRLAPPGTPDILALLPGGRLLGVEVKRPGGKLRPTQEAWADAARMAGAAFLVVRDAADLDRELSVLLGRVTP